MAGGRPRGPVGAAAASAARLLQQVAQYTGAPMVVAGPAVAMAVPVRAVDPQGLRRQLADSSRQLVAILDDHWKTYLALPVEVYSADRGPTAESLRASLTRFDGVATNPQYQILSRRPEFQNTWHLLQQYLAAQPAPAGPTLALPPPPQ